MRMGCVKGVFVWSVGERTEAGRGGEREGIDGIGGCRGYDGRTFRMARSAGLNVLVHISLEAVRCKYLSGARGGW